MLFIFIIVLVLAIAVIASVYISFRITCVRKNPSDVTENTIMKNPAYDSYRERFIKEGKRFSDMEKTPVYIRSREGMLLHADVIKKGGKRVLILMHGYRSSPKSDFSVALGFYESLGFNIILPDQRAHGKSDGRYITFGNLEKDDCLLWIEEAIKIFGEDCEIVLGGISMGASTVLFTAGCELPENVKAIVADCGFYDGLSIVRATAKSMSRYIPYCLVTAVNFCCRILAGFDLRDSDAFTSLKNTKLPILFIHGSADKFVPAEMTVRAFEDYGGEKELLIVPSASHGMSFLVEEERYKATLSAFLNKHLKGDNE